MTKEKLYETALDVISEALTMIDDTDDFKPYVEGIIATVCRLDEQCNDYPLAEGVH